MEKAIMKGDKPNFELHKKLSDLGINISVTTNWDNLLEIILKEEGLEPQIIVSADEITKYNEQKPTIFKMSLCYVVGFCAAFCFYPV